MHQSSCALIGWLSTLLICPTAWALNTSVPAIGGDLSRSILGSGTGVIVGIIDSGIDITHPALAGLDSQGNTRLVAQANFVPTEPGNSGDDTFGHGTRVAGVVLGNDPADIYDGLAPDARFINARVLDSSNAFSSTSWVENGIGFALGQGADVLNLSLNTFSNFSNGSLDMDMMLDWAAEHLGVITTVSAGNISQSPGMDPIVRAPAGLFNGMSVGRTTSDFSKVDSNSATGPTSDGRSKPDLVAPGTNIDAANEDWETQSDFVGSTGTSFAAPHVAGLLTQQIGYGMANGLSTDPLVTKATMMNSASKSVLDSDGNAWQQDGTLHFCGPIHRTVPLDWEAGAGQIDGDRLAQQYLAGEHEVGIVPTTGWDLGVLSTVNFNEYFFDEIVPKGQYIDITLSWLRHITRTDGGTLGVIDASDSFALTSPLDNLRLTLLRNGMPVEISDSSVDNLEVIHYLTRSSGTYSIRITGQIFGEATEEYGLAWMTYAPSLSIADSGLGSITNPEPTTAGLLLIGAIGLIARRRR